jgi:hypothetical protein
MPMRERRAAHVRPLPPSSDRLKSRQIRASAPSSDSLRRHRPVRKGGAIPAPLGIGAVVVFVVLGVAMLVVGGNLLVGVVGHLASAFDSAVSHVSSMPPATIAPSGVALDTPVLDAPENGGYTNQPITSLSGSVPGAAVGKNGYKVRVYIIAKDGTRSQAAEVDVGSTTRFATPAINLAEGPNVFVAALVTPSSEGQPSPEVVYTLDTKVPQLTISSPAENSLLTKSSVVVSGKSDPGSTVTMRNDQSPGSGPSSKVVGEDGRFAITVALVVGSNTIELTATDEAGNTSTAQRTVRRSYGQMAATLSVTPSKFKAASTTTLKLTVHATAEDGSPLAGAKVVFTVLVYGLGPLVSDALTTDAKGSVTWQVTISGATPGIGQAAALVTSSAGKPAPPYATITTT